MDGNQANAARTHPIAQGKPFDRLLLSFRRLARPEHIGTFDYNAQRAAQQPASLSFIDYPSTGHFLDGIFTNWQAALLQLTCLIVFSEIFRPERRIAFAQAFEPRLRRQQARPEKAVRDREPPVPVRVQLDTGTFWFKTVATWQAEFVAIGLFVVLTVFLRQ